MLAEESGRQTAKQFADEWAKYFQEDPAAPPVKVIIQCVILYGSANFADVACE